MIGSHATAIAGSAAVTLASCRIRIVLGHREPPPRLRDEAALLLFNSVHVTVRANEVIKQSGQCPSLADIVAKVAEASLWNSNLKQSNRGVRTFELMLRVRLKT